MRCEPLGMATIVKPSATSMASANTYFYIPAEIVARKDPGGDRVDIRKGLSKRLNGRNGERDALLDEVTAARHHLLQLISPSKLPVPDVGDVTTALNAYMALLWPLVEDADKATGGGAGKSRDTSAGNMASASDADAGGGKDKAVDATAENREGHAGAAKPDGVTSPATSQHRADSSLRHEINWPWYCIPLLQKQELHEARDTQYELTSALLAVAGWCMGKAATVADESMGERGLDETQLKIVFLALRTAAGLYQHCADVETRLLGDAGNDGAEYRQETLTALASLCLADAQAVSIERAVRSGHDHALIVGLCVDVGAVMDDAVRMLDTANVAHMASVEKLRAYCLCKKSMYLSLAHIHKGLEAFAQDKAAEGLASAAAAVKLANQTVTDTRQFDKCAPRGRKLADTHYVNHLTHCIHGTEANFQRLNSVIYFKKALEETPVLGPAKRLAKAVPWSMPGAHSSWTPSILHAFTKLKASDVPAPPSKTATDATKAGTEGQAGGMPGQPEATEQERKFSCWRALTLAVIMPLIVLLWLVGALVWILLLPVKVFCCPVGMLAQAVWDVVYTLLRLPLNGIRWATGGDWHKPPAAESETGAANANAKKDVMQRT
eukprot:jgi/Mesvir1/7197/Mv19024-RA.1